MDQKQAYKNTIRILNNLREHLENTTRYTNMAEAAKIVEAYAFLTNQVTTITDSLNKLEEPSLEAPKGV